MIAFVYISKNQLEMWYANSKSSRKYKIQLKNATKIVWDLYEENDLTVLGDINNDIIRDIPCYH